MYGMFTQTTGYARPVATGTHGMMVFGTGVDCYLSHRPMFVAPYDYQVLLDVEFDEHGQRALGADRRVGFVGAHSFDTEDFSIAELDPHRDDPRTTFRGTLLRGHLERGPPIARDVVVTVRTVISCSELDPHRLRGRGLMTHLCFGRAGRLYVAHRIGRRPSFDQIVAARLIPGTMTDMLGTPLPDDVRELAFDQAQPIILGQRGFAGQRLRVGETAVAAFQATASADGTHGFLVDIEVERQVYLEVADLA